MKPTPQSKLRKKLTQKLREARASLVRVSSPSTSPVPSSPGGPSTSSGRPREGDELYVRFVATVSYILLGTCGSD